MATRNASQHIALAVHEAMSRQVVRFVLKPIGYITLSYLNLKTHQALA